MNEILSTSINEILQRVLTGVDSTVAFLSEEIPDVIMQLLYWNATEGAILSLLGIVLLIVCYQCVKPSRWVSGVMLNSRGDDLCTKGGVSLFTGIGTGILGVVLFVSNILTPIQIWIAPKVWLLEYASTLTK